VESAYGEVRAVGERSVGHDPAMSRTAIRRPTFASLLRQRGIDRFSAGRGAQRSSSGISPGTTTDLHHLVQVEERPQAVWNHRRRHHGRRTNIRRRFSQQSRQDIRLRAGKTFPDIMFRIKIIELVR